MFSLALLRKQDAATGYKPGLYACIACCLLTIILVCIVDTFFYIANKKADRGEKELEAHEVSFSHILLLCSNPQC